MKKLAIGLTVLAAICGLGVIFRHKLLVSILALVFQIGGAPELSDPQDEGDRVEWIDDYYTLEWLDHRTIAIGEPRYYQQNINYLLMGENRAILFDAGAGVRQIRPIAEQLTDLPITFIPSHFHYDHLGDGLPFDRIAVVDLPHIRRRANNDQLTLNWQEHLGASEGFGLPTFTISEWLAPGDSIDLGGRVLKVIFSPGHTNDSISLYDAAADMLFAGDFLYEGPLFAFLPNSSLGDYAQGAERVEKTIGENTRIYGAHRTAPPGTPVLKRNDVVELRSVLRKVRNHEQPSKGVYPVTYPINDRISLWADPEWLQNWKVSYPEHM